MSIVREPHTEADTPAGVLIAKGISVTRCVDPACACCKQVLVKLWDAKGKLMAIAPLDERSGLMIAAELEKIARGTRTQ